jgi:uroporphyrinogen decarboxylase
MTPKERVLNAIAHRETDRVPVHIHLTPEVSARLKAALGGRSPEQTFSDLRFVGPRFRGQLRKPAPNSGVPRSNADVGSGLALERGVDTYDIWGIGYRNVRNEFGAYSEAVDLPWARIKTLEEVEAYPWPSPDDYDYSPMADAAARQADYPIVFGGAGIPDIINSTSRGRGMEQVLMDVASEDPVGLAVIDRRIGFWLEHVRRGLEAGKGKIDILALGEDLGNQNGPMISPRTFDRVFRPRLQKFFDLGKQHGCKVMTHMCGSNRARLPALIEMGLDVYDACQPEPAGMDPEALKRDFGDRLTFCGLVSTQHTLPHGTVSDVRREVEHRIRVVGRNGGYILAPAHCIQPDTPVENVLEVYRVAMGADFPR